jgi:glycosyltransferase involved in cell wall biosynthesis
MSLSRKTLIVVPCYNEASRLECAAFEAALSAEQNLEFVFVNDGSKDTTGQVLAGLRQRAGERAHVLELPRNCGKAEAVRQGVLNAFELGAVYIGYWDADLATPLGCIEEFARELEARHVSLILGSRVRLMGRHIDRRAVRHYIGRGFATLAAFSLGFAVYDTQCGAKLFRATDVFRDAFSTPFDLNWTFDVEFLMRLKSAQGFDVFSECVEYPLPQWVDSPGSKLNFAHYPGILLEFVRLLGKRLSKPKSSSHRHADS